ncbi:MAG: ABC transporter permease [Chrysiogenales bacterium]|nr:MAG: ABC transporter permease [Chrysiogenales bacterium]
MIVETATRGLSRIGRSVFTLLEFSGFTIMLFFTSVGFFKNIITRRREIVRQMYNAGARTFSVITVVALFTGMILTLQTGVALRDYNMEENIGNVVIATLTREMGPFTAAIILIAAVGSAMAAELGTMKVSEEIDALQVMSISPEDYLVMPRLVALAIMLPVATIYVNALGVIGGAIIARSHLGISFGTFYLHVLESLWFKPAYVGLLKSFVFGIVISVISCAHGLRATDGARGVGRATRNSVVASFLMVLIVGYYITDIFFREGP